MPTDLGSSRRRPACGDPYTDVMTVVEWPQEPGLMVLLPDAEA
jgi:hypothetical protein